MEFPGHTQLFRSTLILGLALCSGVPGAAQSGQPPKTAASGSFAELQKEVHELKEMVQQLQQQTTASREEIIRLRQELQAREGGGTAVTAESQNARPESAGDEQAPAHTYSTTAQLNQRLDHLQEDQQLLSDKVDEQYQTKVESASKYRVRLSGIVLFNLFGNQGSVDNQDVPTWAVHPDPQDSSGSVGGTLRQSILGLEVFGPEIAGAHTSGDINFDFGGGFPATYNGVNSALVRLRTGTIRFDWTNTSVVGGQDQLFFAPLAPTSFASLIVPALAYTGNLWSWTPQLRVEHRFTLSEDSHVSLQGGLLDPLTGEPPAYHYTWYRSPDAGESSRQPGYAARVAYSHALLGQTFTLGAGGYYSRENWGYGRTVNGWAATLDLNLPLSQKFTLSAALYRGEAIGGLGAALGRSVLYNGPLYDPNTSVIPLNAVGGWAQLKFRATEKLEFNGAFGMDNPFAADIRAFGDNAQSYDDPYITRNLGAFGNVIYRPRSDLLLSLEYRRLKTYSIYNTNEDAGQLNMSMGILF